MGLLCGLVVLLNGGKWSCEVRGTIEGAGSEKFGGGLWEVCGELVSETEAGEESKGEGTCRLEVVEGEVEEEMEFSKGKSRLSECKKIGDGKVEDRLSYEWS